MIILFIGFVQVEDEEESSDDESDDESSDDDEDSGLALTSLIHYSGISILDLCCFQIVLTVLFVKCNES